MKKILLTFTAFAFGATISFAQTNQEDHNELQQADIQIERMSNKAEMAGKKKIDISQLPLEVQEAFQNSEFKDWEVAGIYEVPQQEQSNMQEEAILEEGSTGTGTEAAVSSEVSYEIALISKDMKDEIEDTQESVTEEQEDAVEDEEVEVTTETVSVKVPAVILHYDKAGKLLSKEEQPQSSEAPEQEQY